MKRIIAGTAIAVGLTLLLIADIWVLAEATTTLGRIAWLIMNGFVLVAVGTFPGWWEE